MFNNIASAMCRLGEKEKLIVLEAFYLRVDRAVKELERTVEQLDRR